MEGADGALDALGALADPVRRRIYRQVAAAGVELGRDAVAEAAGISRSLAAFHLDKLVAAGLLAVEYRRLSGRTGPGAGRPAKLYRRAAGEFAVSVPPRGYDGAGRLLAEVVERAGLDRELQAAARAAGAAEAVGADGDLVRELRGRGYEPFLDEKDEADGGGGAVVRLRNCPFHALAEEFPALVCGMNLALLAGLAGEGWTAEMSPCAGGCCVALSKNNMD
ncbi:helix-turn-helix transcriptional regulator [Kitasatospora sp. NPDC088391]|uniref:helix-turn-helix transcriptional regulator n=1 Tax=Kitasatospora sp. NPDC088391 TaxID=3364074 RepID=UPI00382051A9